MPLNFLGLQEIIQQCEIPDWFQERFHMPKTAMAAKCASIFVFSALTTENRL